jgi:hypothetical protein
MTVKMPIPSLRSPTEPTAAAKGGRPKPSAGGAFPGRPAQPGQRGLLLGPTGARVASGLPGGK